MTYFTELDKKLSKISKILEDIRVVGVLTIKEQDLLVSSLILLTQLQLELLRREKKENKGKDLEYGELSTQGLRDNVPI